MPAATGILTVEFKTNLLAPARGERFAFRATVVKPGRTLTVCEARAYAMHDGVETLIATMSGTLMALAAREGRRRTGRPRRPDPCCSAALCCRHSRIREKILLWSRRATESSNLIISAAQGVLGLASGVLVGFSLGLVGGGGSILAVPLMVYVVGVAEPHVAIGTSAIAVAANAAINLSNHARGGTVIWSCALIFAAAGMAGAFGGSILGKMVDGQKLLALFALVMIVIALLMLKTRSRIGLPDVKVSMSNMPAIVSLGLATGTMSGFFGIGGGFLIVPALMLATGMPIMNAVSSSLVAVTAFGLTTAASYAWSGLVSWALAGLFVAGGIAGGLAGTRSARHLAERRGALNIVFAVVIIAVALYMLARNISLSPA